MISELPVPLNSSKTVSYTHLDVYKRQGGHRHEIVGLDWGTEDHRRPVSVSWQKFLRLQGSDIHHLRCIGLERKIDSGAFSACRRRAPVEINVSRERRAGRIAYKDSWLKNGPGRKT